MTNMRRSHTIAVCRHMPKEAFPHAHTCFFSVDIPFWETEEICRSRIMGAITLCGEIDTDGRPATDFNGDRMQGGGGGWDDY